MSDDVDEDVRRRRRIVDLRCEGKSPQEISRELALTVAEVLAELDQHAANILSTRSRLQAVAIELERLGRLYVKVYGQAMAEAGDHTATGLIVKLSERMSAIAGYNSPTRVDVTTLVEPMQAERPTETAKLLDAIKRLQLDDKRRIRHGGPGYSAPGFPDSRDDEDRTWLEAQGAAE